MRCVTGLMVATLLLAGSAACAAPADLRVSLVTVGPGDAYWSRFGHNAIWIESSADDWSVMYNFGIFDFSEKHFFWNFLRGRMTYLAAAFPAEQDLAAYRAEGRRITIQRLNLTQPQAGELLAYLEWHRRPENRRYPYDYYLNNCSTKVRDALNRVLGGRLQGHFEALPAARGDFRWHTNRLSAPDLWMYLGTDLAGPFVDQPISRWDEFFLPMELAAGLRELRVEGPAGRSVPLVMEEYEVPVAPSVDEPAAPPSWDPWFLVTGLALAGGLLAADGGRRIVASRAWWAASGLFGVGLLALWLGTEHTTAEANANLLLFSPFALGLALLPADHGASRLFAGGLGVSLLLALVTQLPPLRIQDNLAWAILVLPMQLAALRQWLRRRRFLSPAP